MISLLRSILCAVTNIPYYLLHLVVVGINALIAGLGAIIGAAVSAMPGMPSEPALPDTVAGVVSWVAWVIPVSTIIDILTFSFAAWLLWQVVMIGLRWAKASGE